MLLDILSCMIIFIGFGVGAIISSFMLFTIHEDTRNLLIGGIITSIVGIPILVAGIFFITLLFSGSIVAFIGGLVGLGCLGLILDLIWKVIGEFESVKYFHYVFSLKNDGGTLIGKKYRGTIFDYMGDDIGRKIILTVAIPFVTCSLACVIVLLLRQ